MDMKKWKEDIFSSKNKKAIPILTFPAIQLMNISVKEFINDSEIQAKAMKMIADRIDPLATLGIMDLSVEAECFGSEIRFSDEEVPTVIGSIVSGEEEAKKLAVPLIGSGRTSIYIEAIKQASKLITDRPVLAGTIGPFSLAGRLMDVSEAMIYCYDDPDMVHIVLEKTTAFITNYIMAYKQAGASGVVIAEPLAGVLSPDLANEFSNAYVKKIISEVSDENFFVIYHNCGASTIKMVDSLLDMKADGYHFGNAIDMLEMLKLMPKDQLVMGNIDPSADFRNGSLEQISTHTKELLERCQDYDNFVISSGCDIPPLSKWENIDAFMRISKQFYEKQ